MPNQSSNIKSSATHAVVVVVVVQPEPAELACRCTDLLDIHMSQSDIQRETHLKQPDYLANGVELSYCSWYTDGKTCCDPQDTKYILLDASWEHCVLTDPLLKVSPCWDYLALRACAVCSPDLASIAFKKDNAPLPEISVCGDFCQATYDACGDSIAFQALYPQCTAGSCCHSLIPSDTCFKSASAWSYHIALLLSVISLLLIHDIQ